MLNSLNINVYDFISLKILNQHLGTVTKRIFLYNFMCVCVNNYVRTTHI